MNTDLTICSTTHYHGIIGIGEELKAKRDNWGTIHNHQCGLGRAGPPLILTQYENRSYIPSEFSDQTWSFIRYGKHWNVRVVYCSKAFDAYTQKSARIGNLGPGSSPYSSRMIPRGLLLRAMNHTTRPLINQSSCTGEHVEIKWSSTTGIWTS
jgi:hypothetical protein